MLNWSADEWTRKKEKGIDVVPRSNELILYEMEREEDRPS